MKKFLRMGVIGCAGIAERYMLSAIKSANRVCLVAVASRSKTKAENFAKIFGCDPVCGYENIISRQDVDAVYIPLPPSLHEKWAIESLNAGKHVLCEKPFTTSYSESKKVINEARKRGLLVMENFMFVHHPQHSFVKDIIASGEIGEIRLFKGAFGFPPLSKSDIRYSKKLGGGALLDAGGYPIRAARLFLGNNLKGIGASLSFDKSLGVDIYGAAMFKNDADQIAQVSFGFDNYYQCNYRIWGSKGAIFVKRAYSIPPQIAPEITLEKQDIFKTFILPPASHFQITLDIFAEEVDRRNNYESHYSSILEQARLIDYVKRQINQSNEGEN